MIGNSPFIKALSMDQLPEEAWTTMLGEDSPTEAKTFFQSVPWFQRAVILRAQALAGLPFEIRRGESIVDQSEDYQGVLKWLPDPSRVLWLTEASLVVNGESYFERIRTRFQDKALKYMIASSIKPVYSAEEGLVGFKRRVQGEWMPLELEQVLYFWLPDPYKETGPGTPPAMAALMAAGVLENVDRFADLYFKRGAIKATLLTVDGVKEQTRTQIRDWWRRFIGGGMDNAHRAEVFSGEKINPVVVGEGIKELSDVSLTREKREDISTAFGIPRSILFSDEANFSTAGQHRKNFYEDTVIPEARRVEQALNRQLFEPAGLMFRFLPESLSIFQEDEEQRAGALLNYKNAGIPLDVAVRLLGIDMSEDDMARIEEAAQQKEEQRERLGQVAPIPAPPLFTGDQQRTAMLDDLKLWEKHANKKIRRGRDPAARKFHSDHIPPALAAAIHGALEEATTSAQVRAVFSDVWMGYP